MSVVNKCPDGWKVIDAVMVHQRSGTLKIQKFAPYSNVQMDIDESDYLILSKGQDLAEGQTRRWLYLAVTPEVYSSFVNDELVFRPTDVPVEETENYKAGYAQGHFDGNSGLTNNIEALTRLVVEWADERIPDRKPIQCLTKLVMEEIPELITSDFDEMEVADVGILILDLCSLLDINLDTVVRKKMQINKSRSWAVDQDTGLMNHVK